MTELWRLCYMAQVAKMHKCFTDGNHQPLTVWLLSKVKPNTLCRNKSLKKLQKPFKLFKRATCSAKTPHHIHVYILYVYITEPLYERKITVETRGVDVKLGLLQFVAQLTSILQAWKLDLNICPFEIKMAQTFRKTNMK